MPSSPKIIRIAAALAALVLLWGVAKAAAQGAGSSEAERLPAELKGARIYHFPNDNGSSGAMNNLVTYKRVAYQDISTERLVLSVYISLQPVDRDATVTKLYFQNVQVGGFPVRLDPYAREFKLSKNASVDLPDPLQCEVVYSDLGSLATLRDMLDKQKILVTGESFVQVKLNTVQKIFMRSKDVVIPVKFSQEVEMFTDSPLMKLAASKILDLISDPTTTAAVSVARDHVQKIARDRALSSLAQNSVYMIYCEYVLHNPTGASEQFTQMGTGFVVSDDGRILTAKRVIQPWKFDPQVAYLISKYHLELDPKGYRVAAWPAGAAIRMPGGSLNFQTALSAEHQTLQILKAGADKPEKFEYTDPDSGEKATVEVESAGANDVAILQAHGEKFQALTLGGPDDAGSPASLLGYPYGLSQPAADPHSVDVRVSRQGNLFTLEAPLDPGESGAPLVNGSGKVIGLAAGGSRCIPSETFRSLIP